MPDSPAQPRSIRKRLETWKKHTVDLLKRCHETGAGLVSVIASTNSGDFESEELLKLTASIEADLPVTVPLQVGSGIQKASDGDRSGEASTVVYVRVTLAERVVEHGE